VKQFWALTFVQIKMHMGLADLFSSLRGSKKDKLRGVGYIALFLFICGSLIGVVSFLMNALFKAAMMPVLQQTVLALIILAGMLVVLLFGIFYAISLYYSKDNEFLMSLPLKKSSVFASKFVVALLGEIGTFALLVVPALIIYSLHVNVEPSFFVKGLFVVLLGPMIPFAIANILAALVMRISVLSRHKNKITIIGGFILLVGYLFLNQIISSNMAQMNTNDIMMVLSGGLVKTVTTIFPPARWAAAALVFHGGDALMGFLLFMGVSVLAFFVCIYFAGQMYGRSASSQGETIKKNRRVSVDELGHKAKTPVFSIFFKEWKLLLRSPVYAMNALTTVVLAPLMVAVIVLTPVKGMNGGMETVIHDLLMSGGNGGTFLLIGAAYCYLMASINTACMTMYSREGEALWILQVLPVEAKHLYRGKLLCSLSISALAVFTTSIAFIFLLNIPVWIALSAALLGLFACTPMLIVMLMLDMIWPKLHWDSERRAMKGNINAFLGIMIAYLFGPLLGFLGYLLIQLGLSLLLSAILLSVLCAAFTVFMYVLSIKKSQRLLNRMAER